MEVEWADRGDRAIRKIRFERPDVAVIDLMLPGMDGWRIIESLRADDVQIPVIVVSARASEQDKVHALGIGGDDYLAKPFGMDELVARVQAAVRRAGLPRATPPEEPVEVPGLVIDPALHQAFLDGRDAELTRTEFRLLLVLASERGPRADARPAAAAGVGGAAPAARPVGRRVRAQAAREARLPLARRTPTSTRTTASGYRFDAGRPGARRLAS